MLFSKFAICLWNQFFKTVERVTIPTIIILGQIGQIPNFPQQNYEYSRFFEWCVNYSRLTPDAKNTVKALVSQNLGIFDSSSTTWQNIVDTDKCMAVDKALTAKESISFDKKDSISNLAPIATLKNLKKLNLEWQQIEDLTPLSELEQLEELDLSHNLIRDTTALSSLQQLKKLDLSSNLIYFISPISSLTKLEELYIARASISDIEALNSLTNLKKLDLASNNISNIESLSSLLNLEKLDLSYNLVRDIAPLTSLNNIVELKVESNYIPPESQICPVDKLIACNDLNNQKIANYSIEEINIFQRQEQILERNRKILRDSR